jgi:hypothetical protein
LLLRQAILISKSTVGMVLFLFLGTDEIPWCDAVTDLGVVIDGRLCFDRQVTKVCLRVYATLHRLRLLKILTPKQVRLKLCKALLLLYFFYFDVVFLHLSSVDGRRLQVAFNSCTIDMCLIFVVMTSRRNEFLAVFFF